MPPSLTIFGAMCQIKEKTVYLFVYLLILVKENELFFKIV